MTYIEREHLELGYQHSIFFLSADRITVKLGYQVLSCFNVTPLVRPLLRGRSLDRADVF